MSYLPQILCANSGQWDWVYCYINRYIRYFHRKGFIKTSYEELWLWYW